MNENSEASDRPGNNPSGAGAPDGPSAPEGPDDPDYKWRRTTWRQIILACVIAFLLISLGVLRFSVGLTENLAGSDQTWHRAFDLIVGFIWCGLGLIFILRPIRLLRFLILYPQIPPPVSEKNMTKTLRYYRREAKQLS